MSNPSRRTIRLRDFDYTCPGAYFVTICTYDRACLFGVVDDGEVRLNAFGEIVREEWERSAKIRTNVISDAFVVMPNHFHGMLLIDGVGAMRCIARNNVQPKNRATHRIAPTSTGLVSGSVGAIIGQFKSITTKRINLLHTSPGHPVWQRNYYEHVIRDDRDLAAIRDYIAGNPARWDNDENHPGRAITQGRNRQNPLGFSAVLR